jgi:hypothetical protein
MSRTVAILGSSGHIAQSLIPYLLLEDEFELFLFSRKNNYFSYDDFNNYDYDIILNCTGSGVNIKSYYSYFELNSIDDMCINYLRNNSKTFYINLSSGVIENSFDFKKENYYAITKLYQEAKHRSLELYNIADLRIYSYFSDRIDLKDNYFICDIVNSVIEKKPFITDYDDFIRDYLSPFDLYQFIRSLQPSNKSYTLGSKLNISKTHIIEIFKYKYNLKVQYDNIEKNTATGTKFEYYPKKIDNKPEVTSIENIINSTDNLLKKYCKV